MTIKCEDEIVEITLSFAQELKLVPKPEDLVSRNLVADGETYEYAIRGAIESIVDRFCSDKKLELCSFPRGVIEKAVERTIKNEMV